MLQPRAAQQTVRGASERNVRALTYTACSPCTVSYAVPRLCVFSFSFALLLAPVLQPLPHPTERSPVRQTVPVVPPRGGEEETMV